MDLTRCQKVFFKMKNKKKRCQLSRQRVQSSSLKNDQVAARSALSIPFFFANNSDRIFRPQGRGVERKLMDVNNARLWQIVSSSAHIHTQQSTVHTHTHTCRPPSSYTPPTQWFVCWNSPHQQTMMWWSFPVSCLLERLIAGHVVEWICAALKTRSQDLW